MTNEEAYRARLAATESNLRRFVNQTIGVINAAQAGDIPEEEAFDELDKLDATWAQIIVDDLAPLQTIIT